MPSGRDALRDGQGVTNARDDVDMDQHLAAAVATLGERGTAVLMADPQLLGISVAISQPA